MQGNTRLDVGQNELMLKWGIARKNARTTAQCTRESGDDFIELSCLQ